MSIVGRRLFCALAVLVFSFLYILHGEPSRKFSNIDVARFWRTTHRDIGKSHVLGDQHLGYDSRLLPALWLHRLLEFLETDKQKFSVPFSWADFSVDNYDYLLLDNGREAALDLVCQSSDTEHCRVSSPSDEPFSPQIRKFLGQKYLANASVPSRILFLGLMQQNHTHKALQVDLFRGEKMSLAKSYCKETQACQIDLKTQVNNVHVQWDKFEARAGTKSGIQVFESHDSEDTRTVTSKEFQLQDIGEARSDFASHPQKYFHEAHLLGTSAGSHYDWRFFHRADFSELEHRTVLHRLARAWLRFCCVSGLKTWLAHGSLLGWYWNGLSMPWDEDMDVQMTLQSLYLLSESFNQTIVVECTDDPHVSGAHQYFIDVSPHFLDRSMDSAQNIIDARFIDIGTGMYVDITALSITEPQSVLHSTASDVKLHAVFDSEYALVTKSAAPTSAIMDQYLRKLKDQELESSKEGQLLNCKSGHFYQVDEIGPLIETHFEGAKAFVPNAFKKILEREYPKGLRLRHFNDWVFRPFLSLWVPKSVCADDLYGDKCQDEETLLEHRFTEGIRLSREKWFESVKGQPRVDPYIVHQNEELNRAPAIT